MLEKCKTVLLLSDVENFASMFRQLARAENVSLYTEAEWNVKYRVTAEKVICGSKYLPYLQKAYYGITVVILKAGEDPEQYMREGITQFIFDHTNQYELKTALFKQSKIIVHGASLDLKHIIEDSATEAFRCGDYDFNFARNNFLYKGRAIYLQEAQKRYLAEWLLHGYKDNKKRMIVCNLRKKFGADFLKDIDRFGRLKEE